MSPECVCEVSAQNTPHIIYYIILKMPILSGSRNTQIVVPVSLNPNELLLPPPFQNRAAPFQLVPASVANLATLSLDLATFQTPLATFFLKRLATNLATFGKILATYQMWPVLSCEREILSYTSPCVCSDQWALAPAERSSTFSDRTEADIDVNELPMCTRCCHGPITCLLLLCLK